MKNRRLGVKRSLQVWAAVVLGGTALSGGKAGAQEAAVPLVAEETEAEQAQSASEVSPVEAVESDDAEAAVDKLPAPAESPETQEMKAELAELRAAVAALNDKQEEAELQAALNQADDVQVEEDILQIYGFMDMGLQKTWASEKSLVSAQFATNSWSFVVGNINLYFDLNPHPDWRGLAELRLTGGAHGEIESYGGITGEDFSRTNLEQNDPHGTAINQPMWPGAIVIERAWIEWKRYQLLRVRVGSFFTPFGIWNVDHGSPTLIATALPQFALQKFFPARQTGIQALGSVFQGQHEFAYHAWLSNGRTETANVDFTDDKAVGARALVKKVGGDIGYQLGASVHHGRVGDKVVNITEAPPIDEAVVFDILETQVYHETVIGADVSIDMGATRLRVEGAAQLRIYEEGKRPPYSPILSPPGATAADSWRFSVYALLAHRFEWGGLEPYISGEIIQQDQEVSDGLAVVGPGLNVHFSAQAQLKLQASRGVQFDWRHTFEGDKSLYNASNALARVVLAF